ncbi:hypothetical protein BDW22DRAFT_1343584 [Trametopsis cervina]|nr:hypothetical protein BDW22DRAFT_1343584 [Trametopsis cervina]
MPPPSPMRGPPLNLNTQHNPYPAPGPMSPGVPPAASPVAEIDTKIGGEAGMAGVGRRGFAAAARAAMFAHQVGGMHPGTPDPHMSMSSQYAGMDGRRANAPRFLDIASANQYVNTPPLSPGSTASPRSPYSQQSPLSASTPVSPPLHDRVKSTTPTQSIILTRTPSPMEGGVRRSRVIPPAQEPPKAPLPAIPSTPSMPFFEKFKNKAPAVDELPRRDSPSPPPEPTSPADSDFEGLAYADSTDDEEDNETRNRTISHPTPPPNRVRFPSMSSQANSESKYSSGSSPSVQPLRLRSLSASTTRSSYTAKRATMRHPPLGLDKAMETLLEEDATSPTTSSVSSPAVFPVPLALTPDASQRESVSRPKLPARANTSPAGSRPESRHGAATKRRATEKVRKTRQCLKCDKTIDDGRWIQVEGGGVMCDQCWKNMYLPKCRRCNLTIEKQAVSSSDGQLKGKYHRDCFNCHTCHKPFPDKTFYVFDGKPFCDYHYHEANNSLCAATTCGRPIEGPCAVSHNGDRYHPEHLLCEHPRCTEKLVDYWEVDGRMFCDKHAQGVSEDEEEEYYQRATKRRTQFIDLAALGGQ